MLRRRLDGLDSEDTSIVVFGSLARGEFTAGSDLDWTLLIDGHSDPQHLSVVQDVTTRLEEDRFSGPGREGTFGRMAFSHNIIHQIGLLRYVEATPLGILAYELLEQPHPAAARDLFDAYDHFLALLADPNSRDRLETLTFDELQGDPIFRQVRQIGGQFEKGLQQLFFDPRSRLYELTIRYGVF